MATNFENQPCVGDTCSSPHKDPNARLQEMGTPENSSRDKDLGGLGGLGFGFWGFRV